MFGCGFVIFFACDSDGIVRSDAPPKRVDNDKYYEALGVSKTATAIEIEIAYCKFFLEHHPDKGGDPEIYKAITLAYEVLSDQKKRDRYDQYGEEVLQTSGGDARDSFNQIFYDHLGPPMPGSRDVNTAAGEVEEQPQPNSSSASEQALLCKYSGRVCTNERAVKRNGKRHNLCQEHRISANVPQRRRIIRASQNDANAIMQFIAENQLVEGHSTIETPSMAENEFEEPIPMGDIDESLEAMLSDPDFWRLSANDSASNWTYQWDSRVLFSPSDGFVASRDTYGSSSVWTDPAWIALTTIGKTLDVRLGKLIIQHPATEVWRTACGQYALKRLRGNPSMVEVTAFARQITAASSLSHVRIARPLAVLENAASDLRVVTAFAECGDLRSLLAATAPVDESGLTWEDGKGVIALDVADALAYLHATQPVTVVRDLHTGHVLVDGDGHARVVVTSFTSAQPASTVSVWDGGFPYWLAPDVLKGGVATAASDVYAFGVLLCELDTDGAPFRAAVAATVELVAAVVSGKMRPVVSKMCPPRIEQLVADCMAVDPYRRPSAAQVAYRLHDIVKNDL